jgi:hypothetical protein
MFDKSRRKEQLSGSEILGEIIPNDLITITDGDGIVHIVFPGTGTICRGKMLERGERTWEILGSTDFESYRKTVTELPKKRPCGHCLSWYR